MAAEDVHPGYSQRAAVSNLTVQTLREHTGRGPTKAKTHLTEDAAFVILQDTLLPAERTLVNRGDEDTVIGLRRKFQSAMRDHLVHGVEEITGRKVMSFLSDSQVNPDVSVEMFIFEPRPGEEESP